MVALDQVKKNAYKLFKYVLFFFTESGLIRVLLIFFIKWKIMQNRV